MPFHQIVPSPSTALVSTGAARYIECLTLFEITHDSKLKAFFYFPTFLENWVRTICQGRQQTHCRRTITTSLFSACKQSKALTFYLVKRLYKASYNSFQFFCFRRQCLQNKAFEKLYIKAQLDRKIRLQYKDGQQYILTSLRWAGLSRGPHFVK